MAMYVDVETSPEALQDDVELMEAVNELVVNISGKAQAEIALEVNEIVSYILSTLEYYLPLLFEYHREPHRLWQDLERLTLFLSLVAAAVWLLGPSSSSSTRSPTKSSASSTTSSAPSSPHNIQRSNSSSNGGRLWRWRCTNTESDDDENDELDHNTCMLYPQHLSSPQEESCHSNDDYNHTTTDEERFERVYSEKIMHSGYSKLVLPPTCRRILPTTTTTLNTSNSNHKIKRNSKSNKDTPSNTMDDNSHPLQSPLPSGKSSTTPAAATAATTAEETNDDDNPVARLQYYLRELWLFYRSLLQFDYMTAGLTLWNWLVGLRRIRQNQKSSSSNQSPSNNGPSSNDPAEDTAVDGTPLPDEGTTGSTTADLVRLPVANDDAAVASNADSLSSRDGDKESSTATILDAIGAGNSQSETATAQVRAGAELLQDELEAVACDDTTAGTADLSDDSGVTKRRGDPQSALKQPNVGVKFEKAPTPLAWVKSVPLVTNGRHQSDGSVYFDSPLLGDEGTTTTGDEAASSCESLCNDEASTPMASEHDPLSLLSKAALSASKSTSGSARRSFSQSAIGELTEEGEDYAIGSSALDPVTSANSIAGGWDTSFGRIVKSKDISTSRSPEDQALLSTLNSTADPLPPVPSTPLLATRKQLLLQSKSKVDGSSSSLSPLSSRRHYFDAAQTRSSIHKMSVDCPVPDKNGYILGDAFLPDSTRYTPLLVFVNSRSGPQQGPLLIAQLRRLLNPIQVWDLAEGGPRSILESFMVFARLRLLVCGGDGTVSWIIQTLEDMKIHDQRQYPPIAILPLGTGNDLARIHGWGGGYNYESLITILEQISESYSSLLDRWEVVIQEGKSKKPKEVKGFFNYLGVGADAQAALQVHYLRESRPDWFFSRIINKAMYGVFGAEDIIKATTVNVRREIKLIADGVEIPLPPDSQGIILLNIDAYAGGVPLWSHGVRPEDASSVDSSSLRPRRTRSMSEVDHLSTRLGRFDRVDSVDELTNISSAEERFAHVTACDMPSSCQDGFLDVVSIRGAFHLGQIKVGLSNAQRLCQCREATIIIKNKVAVQVDGEPWRQNACQLTIKRKKDPAVMLHRSADDGGVETEMSKLLDWAEARNMIDSQVHSILMKEFSRRIESKKRQRRVRQSDNIMSTLKKAISSGAMASNGSVHSSWQGGGGGIAF